jgi:enamine deaminase RidA (YjgF/YER057c/UK114 family)
MRHRLIVSLFVLLSPLVYAATALAQETPPKPDPKAPIRIPAPHGEVLLLGETDKAFLYDDWHFASVRVADGIAYVSGVVAGAPSEPVDAAGFEASVVRAFRRIEEHLVALGGSSQAIVNLMTFHVFSSKYFTGDKQKHLDAFRKAKDAVIKEPYPAWTAIGVSELLPERGIVEIHVVAHLPRK